MSLYHYKNLLLLVFLLLPVVSFSATEKGLDREEVKNLYFEGEFEKVKQKLEEGDRPGSLNDEDKIFAYRLLGVVYSADKSTHHKAESYFYQLLKHSPEIELVDLYVSSSVENLFQQVKKRFNREMGVSQQYDELGRPVEADPEPLASVDHQDNPEKTSEIENNDSKSKAWLAWTIGGLAVVGGGVATFVLLSGDGEDQESEAGRIGLE